jgi:hypothetical protein
MRVEPTKEKPEQMPELNEISYFYPLPDCAALADDILHPVGIPTVLA